VDEKDEWILVDELHSREIDVYVVKFLLRKIPGDRQVRVSVPHVLQRSVSLEDSSQEF